MTGVIVIFFLGIANFALHAAVLRSGHPLLREMPRIFGALGGRVTFLMEFAVLLAALLLAAQGWSAPVWVYGGYSLLNAGSAWAMLSGRI